MTESTGGASAAGSLSRVPASWRQAADRVAGSEFGSFLRRVLERLRAAEVFDRAMSIAAQFFTSLIPVSIAVGALAGTEWRLGADLELPPEAAQVVDQAVGGAGNSIGLIGLFLALVLATSLSRTLTRLYCAVFGIPKPVTDVRLAARWLVAVGCFFGAVALARLFRVLVEGLPFSWVVVAVAAVVVQTALWVLVPQVLLPGRFTVRQLLPGAALTGLSWSVIIVASDVVLARILARSAVQYGVMGVAFTYLSWLYVLSLALVVSVVVGSVLSGGAHRPEPARPKV